MLKKIGIQAAVLMLGLGLHGAFAQQRLSANQGHSHNDYKQNTPLLTAYAAQMGSIEADVFLRNGALYVAHDSTEIRPGRTLKALYIDPLVAFYQKNGKHAYANPGLKLQLVIDIKQDPAHVLPELIEELKSNLEVFNFIQNPNAIRIVMSGDVPLPEQFNRYPEWISFDGRPYISYSKAQLKRVAMISDELKNYAVWKGDGNLTDADEAKIRAVIEKTHQQGKPFRFWGTRDHPKVWMELEKLGVDWINTDVPEGLHAFYAHPPK